MGMSHHAGSDGTERASAVAVQNLDRVNERLTGYTVLLASCHARAEGAMSCADIGHCHTIAVLPQGVRAQLSGALPEHLRGALPEVRRHAIYLRHSELTCVQMLAPVGWMF